MYTDGCDLTSLTFIHQAHMHDHLRPCVTFSVQFKEHINCHIHMLNELISCHTHITSKYM